MAPQQQDALPSHTEQVGLKTWLLNQDAFFFARYRVGLASPTDDYAFVEIHYPNQFGPRIGAATNLRLAFRNKINTYRQEV